MGNRAVTWIVFLCFQRRLLAIYLHHDSSIMANVFCSQILCSETIVSYLSSNFLTWAWDLTSEANKARLVLKPLVLFFSGISGKVSLFRCILIISASVRTS